MNIRELKTPCYIINSEDYESNIRNFVSAFKKHWGNNVRFGYSIKTNNFPYMLQAAMEHDFLAEVVSPDEYEFALRCGCSEDRIIFNGPQKRELVYQALECGATVNLDDVAEVLHVCQHYYEAVSRQPVIGLRVNYDIEAECPGETTCKGIPGRFGICLENGDFERSLLLLKTAGLRLSGIHLHQSSSSRSLNIFRSIARKAVEIGRQYKLDDLSYVDVGGGFFGGNFFPGKPSFDEYAETICRELKEFYSPEKTTLILEPGAAILATSMDYLASVLSLRDIRGSRIVTLDGSLLHINPFMNPHPTPFTMIDPDKETDTGHVVPEKQIIAGSTCMELDRFLPRDMHELADMDSKFLFHACGAYMSTHNSYFINAAPNIYLFKDGDYTLLRKKSIDNLFC